MERILHFCLPPKPTAEQIQCIEAAKSTNADWEVKVWTDDALDEDFLLTHYLLKANSGAQRGDLIRLDAVYKYGGVYLDSDITLHKNLSPLCDNDNFFCSEDGYNLTNAAFGATAKNPIIRELIDNLLTQEPDWSVPPNITTGPVFFARVLQWNRAVKLLPRETFYPYNWNEPPVSGPSNTHYGTHAWNQSWKPLKVAPTSVPAEAKQGLKSKVKRLAKSYLNPVRNWISRPLIDAISSTAVVYPYGTDLIAKTSRGLFMSLPGKDINITPEIALKATYEERELSFLERHIKGGDFFVDVGCNIGLYTLVAGMRVGPFGRVYAIDPNVVVLEHLQRSLAMNWFHDRTVVINQAMGSTSGEITLRYSEQMLGCGNVSTVQSDAFSETNKILGATTEKRVLQGRLDDLFPREQELKILKIDVEGHEYEVLQGADRLLKQKCFGYIMMECLEGLPAETRLNNFRALKTLVDYGYSPGRIDGEGLFTEDPGFVFNSPGSRNIVLRRC